MQAHQKLLLVLNVVLAVGCSSLPGQKEFGNFKEAPMADAEVMPSNLRLERPKVLILDADDGADRLAQQARIGAALAKSVTQVLSGRSIEVVDNALSPQLVEALRKAEAAGDLSYAGPKVADIAIKPVISRAEYGVNYTPPGMKQEVVTSYVPNPAFNAAASAAPSTTTTTTNKTVTRGNTNKTASGAASAASAPAGKTTSKTVTRTTSAAPAQPAVPAQIAVYNTVMVPTPASFGHAANMVATLQVYEMPSMRLLASVPVSGQAGMSSPTEPANDGTGMKLLRNATDNAVRAGSAQLLNVFAPKGYVAAKRTHEKQSLFQISLGSQDGLKKGDTVLISSVRKQAPLFDGKPLPDEEVAVVSATVTEILATTTAWVSPKDEAKAALVRRGDVAKTVYGR